MDGETWNTAYSSVIGTSHKKTGIPCQDASSCRVIQSPDGHHVLLAAVSDGAGSASHSDIGSSLTVEHFIHYFSTLAIQDSSLNSITKEVCLNWLNTLNDKIIDLATTRDLNSNDFICTLVSAIIGKESAIFLQIGDGAIVISEIASEEYGYIFWPQHGEFANQTHFLFQENTAETIQFVSINRKFESIALFSDGIERLILDFSTQEVFAPALQPIFKWLQESKLGHNDCPSHVLTAYLQSPHINNRTDDDKSLIMAVRSCGDIRDA